MNHTFFPLPAFGWAYLAALMAMLVPASFIDARRLVIPKSIALTTLGLGLAFNLARGAWLGAGGSAVWCLGAHGAFVGLIDGFLFALAGFLVGFALFFVLWQLGTCGGGDVKLFAALGAWVGPGLVVVVMGASAVIVAAIVIARTAWRVATHVARPGGGGTSEAQRARRRLVSFSAPVALATAVVLLWAFRDDLGLSPPPHPALAANPAPSTP